ncbi:hypothetical protein [Pseudomonas sp. NPDC089734]|uniref:hypothetical protein n=1 Tax=Pseudomonas sp. NPDC089734 TaxID=3364469 RepID=UPI0038076135
MDRCAINFIARHWWRRVEIWVIAALLAAGSLTLGFQAGQWSAGFEHTRQLAEIRRAYDAAMGKRDVSMARLAESATEAVGKAESAASVATQAANTASRAADKADAALSKASQ